MMTGTTTCRDCGVRLTNDGTGWDAPVFCIDGEEWHSPVVPYHAHYGSESRDCDGKYTRGHDYVKGEGRIQGEDDDDFERRIISFAITLHPDGEFTMNVVRSDDPDRGPIIRTYEATEEGYEATEIRFCRRDDIDRSSYYRDHTAEAAGY